VKEADDGAIQIPQEAIPGPIAGEVFVGRERLPDIFLLSLEEAVIMGEQVQVPPGRKVEAVPEVYDSANHA
jgi:hypothetical protein